jgi:branched-chain amino acid transport system permease protein
MHDYALTLIGNIALLSMLAASVYLILLTGELSLGQQGFFGIGAYAAALATAGYSLSPGIALLSAVVVGAVAGFCLASVTIPVKGLMFSLSTVAFGEAVRTGFGLVYFDPDGAGPQTGPAGVEGFGNIRFIFDSGLGLHGATMAVVAILFVMLLGIAAVERTRWGVRVRAVGQDEDLARQLGFRPDRIKIVIITISGALAALAGALFAHFTTFIEPANFSVMLGIHALAYVLIGGIGHVTGVVLGVGLDILVFDALREISQYRMILFGGAVALLLRIRPQGLIDPATVHRIRSVFERRQRR